VTGCVERASQASWLASQLTWVGKRAMTPENEGGLAMRIKLAIISVAVSVLTVSGLAVAGGPGPKATGMGTALKEASGKTAEFNFNAQERNGGDKGKVSVRVENGDGSLNQEFSGNVGCYFPADENTALISGKVKKLERGTNRFDGKNFLIKAVDNDSVDDTFGWHRRGNAKGPFDCDDPENLDLGRDLPVIEGEITVYAG
jgi:hypothetical protein